jgi:mannitol/fructose-specific phosphotransferase system IIA component
MAEALADNPEQIPYVLAELADYGPSVAEIQAGIAALDVEQIENLRSFAVALSASTEPDHD